MSAEHVKPISGRRLPFGKRVFEVKVNNNGVQEYKLQTAWTGRGARVAVEKRIARHRKEEEREFTTWIRASIENRERR